MEPTASAVIGAKFELPHLDFSPALHFIRRLVFTYMPFLGKIPLVGVETKTNDLGLAG
jgi:hypothetical protein